MSVISRLVLAVVAGAAGVGLMPSHAATSEQWVFLGTYTGGTSKGIYVARLDSAGQISAPKLAASAINPSFLVCDPTHRFLYAVNEMNHFHGQKSGAVSAFAIDRRTGQLTLLNQQPSGGPGPAHVAVDATGHAVVIANYDGGSIASFPVAPDGSLEGAASFIQNRGSSVNRDRQSSPHAHCVTFAPGNNFALVCDLGLDQVLVFKLEAAGATLVPNDPAFASTPPGSGPRHLAFGSDGHQAYVVNELACSITQFAFDAEGGSLRQAQTVSTLPAGHAVDAKYSAAEICVHPSGRFLYSSNRGHDTIAVFKIDAATGRLSPIEFVPSGGTTPRCIAIDPSGTFLLSANQNSGNVVVFRIDPQSGKLSPTGGSVAVDRPVSFAFAPAAERQRD